LLLCRRRIAAAGRPTLRLDNSIFRRALSRDRAGRLVYDIVHRAHTTTQPAGDGWSGIGTQAVPSQQQPRWHHSARPCCSSAGDQYIEAPSFIASGQIMVFPDRPVASLVRLIRSALCNLRRYAGRRTDGDRGQMFRGQQHRTSASTSSAWLLISVLLVTLIGACRYFIYSRCSDRDMSQRGPAERHRSTLIAADPNC